MESPLELRGVLAANVRGKILGVHDVLITLFRAKFAARDREMCHEPQVRRVLASEQGARPRRRRWSGELLGPAREEVLAIRDHIAKALAPLKGLERLDERPPRLFVRRRLEQGSNISKRGQGLLCVSVHLPRRGLAQAPVGVVLESGDLGARLWIVDPGERGERGALHISRRILERADQFGDRGGRLEATE